MNTDIKVKSAKKYFIYCRKSSDSEDKQIASLPDQVKVMSDIAGKYKLKIVDILTESKSAFKIGRPVFNQMIGRINKGEANAVLCWDASRIARNSMDSGTFIYLMDERKLLELKTPNKTFINTADDKMSLNIDFTMTKKYSDDLSNNVHRGNRHKFFELKEWGGVAKPGYLNYTDSLTKENHIMTDPDRFPVIQRAISRILDGTHTPMESLRELNKEGYSTRKTKSLGGRPLSRASFYRIISDSYYCGIMKRKVGDKREIGDSSHEPMISEDQFDLLQIRLGKKGKPRYGKNNFPYKNLLKCGECGGSVTCEEKWQIICPICKTKFHRGKSTDKCSNCQTKIEDMANPKILHYIFYHCTKRVHKNCSQGGISIEKLEKKIDETLQGFEIDKEYLDFAIDHLNELNSIEEQDQVEIRERLNKRLSETDWSLRNLVKLRIRKENVEDYEDSEKQKIYDDEEDRLMSERTNLKEQIDKLDLRQKEWIELSKETFDFAFYARHHFATGDILTKVKIASKLGSNLTIQDRELRIDGENAFFLIKKGKEEIKEIINSLEPEKIPDSSTSLLALDSVCQSWRRR
jgi:DNA invertase Pin-like site-specific DNA recombinase